MVCPFGAVTIHERKAHKCHQCPDRDTPACIKACSQRAIAKVDTDQLQAQHQLEHIKNLQYEEEDPARFGVDPYCHCQQPGQESPGQGGLNMKELISKPELCDECGNVNAYVPKMP